MSNRKSKQPAASSAAFVYRVFSDFHARTNRYPTTTECELAGITRNGLKRLERRGFLARRYYRDKVTGSLYAAWGVPRYRLKPRALWLLVRLWRAVRSLFTPRKAKEKKA